eukprot:MONOS_16243.1-p1 / transcript=MONOS_16243.1 / gene=MONOS_16243 / organism=Monocercomonoides_exilis_PA203 / gene_product=unspecified product / transcript_product=unspecified product / location=Mono_scaffold01585:4933-5176(-) / protein_length=49 / sequence_SO=supercontig / SO=protein_coding / is_pseudo=false
MLDNNSMLKIHDLLLQQRENSFDQECSRDTKISPLSNKNTYFKCTADCY